MVPLFLMIAMGVVFYKLASFEEMDSPYLWMVMSIVVSSIAIYVLNFGLIGFFLIQLPLVGAMMIRKIFIERRSHSTPRRS